MSIVRLYEALGERSTGVVKANFPVRGLHAVDLLERPVDAPGVDGRPAIPPS